MSWRRASRSSKASSLRIRSASAARARTRSTTRVRRLEVERTSVPDAEMSTAGVIIAPRTSLAAKVVFMRIIEPGARRGASRSDARAREDGPDRLRAAPAEGILPIRFCGFSYLLGPFGGSPARGEAATRRYLREQAR